LSDVSEDSEAKIDAANAMLDELEKKQKEEKEGENSDDEDMEKSKLEKFG